MSDQSRKTPADAEAEIWNAIAAFEKILEALPDDRVSLETLADAYEKVGDHTRAKEYVIRLSNVLIDEGEADTARETLRKLTELDPNDPRFNEISARIEEVKPEKVMADVLEDHDTITRRSVNIAAEISFAWNLLQANKLTQDEYSKVVHDLSENSTRAAEIAVSTLHVLYDMNFPNISSILGFVSSSCKIPIISLANFEFQQAAASLLPASFAMTRGAILFELMGNDALVAILNPYDDELPMDIESLTGKICHFFLVTPEDFDRTLKKVKEMEAESESTKT